MLPYTSSARSAEKTRSSAEEKKESSSLLTSSEKLLKKAEDYQKGTDEINCILSIKLAEEHLGIERWFSPHWATRLHIESGLCPLCKRQRQKELTQSCHIEGKMDVPPRAPSPTV